MSEELIEQKLHQLRTVGAQYADARGRVAEMEEWKKSQLSVLMKEYEVKGVRTTAAQERDARADERYFQTIKALAAAVEAEEKLRWHVKSIELSIEVWRTKQANQRSERQGYGRG